MAYLCSSIIAAHLTMKRRDIITATRWSVKIIILLITLRNFNFLRILHFGILLRVFLFAYLFLDFLQMLIYFINLCFSSLLFF